MIEIIDHDEIREIRLAAPPANALSPKLLSVIVEALDRAPEEGARAIVLSGQPRMFSGGLDVPYLMGLDREAMIDAWATFYATMRALATTRLPVAAAITGHSPAAGLGLALFCDWRVMAEGSFKVGLNEVQVGIPLPGIIFEALRRTVGLRKAEKLAVAGALVGPDKALRLGLVDQLAPVDGVVEAAVEWARGMLALPPRSMTETRHLARRDLASLFEDIDRRALEEEVGRCWFHPEAQKVLGELVQRLRKG
jgi:enoyl-CoA hydratase/carnithine racemase